MKDFIAGWLIYQLVFIGIVLPVVWNNGVGTECPKTAPTMSITTMAIIATLPLIWFMDGTERPCNKV